MRRLLDIARKLLQEGLSPGKIAFGIALGVTLGIFPIYGPVSMAALLLAWLFGLNKPLVLAGCYAMGFVKPVLILPYLRFGEWLSRAEPMPISLVELTRRFSTAPLATLQEFSWSFAHAAVGWLATVPLLLGVLYLIARLLIDRWQNRREIKDEDSVPDDYQVSPSS